MAGLVVFYLIKNNIFILILATCVITILGFFLTTEAEGIFKKKDASCIVIDEVSGMLLSLLFLPYSIKIVIIAFFVFRILDTLKPYPAGLFQNLKGGAGIMSDDIVAGVYTNIILQIALRLASFKTS
jgi:phosphatidylglycerophosphatase A